MLIMIKLFLNSKLDLFRTVKFVKQLFRIQIQKGGKVLLWNQVKSRIEACYSELILTLLLETPQLGCNYCLDSNFQLVVFIRFCPVDIQTKRNRLAVTIQSSYRHRLLYPLDTFAHIAP